VISPVSISSPHLVSGSVVLSPKNDAVFESALGI
jgi:hypothetical protein